MLDIIN